MHFDANFWDYLSPFQKDLIREGSYLYQEIFNDNKYSFKDYSFVVFPFAKAYEGFVKQFLNDSGFITRDQYMSDHTRVGLLLCPELKADDNRSVYRQISSKYGNITASSMWETWKFCRNQVFHYYPHNNKSIDLNGARERIHMLLITIQHCHTELNKRTREKDYGIDYHKASI
ncbi:MAG: hypothetical protein U0525_01530 [Patescibacteria group bacterium]